MSHRLVRGALHQPGLRILELDVAQMDFIDSNGISVLIGAHHDAGEQGAAFTVVNAGARTRSVLELMGVYDLLTDGDP